MTLWKGFQKPKRLEVENETLSATYGKFYAQPFERGFGTTVGNALRRVLLSSIEGAAITAVKIEGVLHEFSSLPGVVEDVTDIILNLKQIPIKMHTTEEKILTLDVERKGKVTAADLQGDSTIEILEPDAPIATLSENGKPPGGDAGLDRPRLRLGGQELRRGHGDRLHPDRLGPLARAPRATTTSRRPASARRPTTTGWSWKSGPTAPSRPWTPSGSRRRSCATT